MLLPALFSHPSQSANLHARSAHRMLDRDPSAVLKISAKFRKRDLSTPGSHPCASHLSRRLSIRTKQMCCSGVSSAEVEVAATGEGVSTGLAGDAGVAAR